MLNALTLENFRNFSNQTQRFTSRTVITGLNGVGKSTVLEAIRVLSVGKSFRTSRLEEAIRFQERYFRLVADIQTKETAEMFFGDQFADQESRDRRLTYQGNVVGWPDFLGKFPTVMFTPTDLEVVLGSPDLRRRYLDSVLWQISAEYRRNQLEFYRVLRERSALLFMVKINRASTEELGPWNELLIQLTKAIRAARMGYVDYLNSWLKSRLKKANSQIALNYQFDPKEIPDLLSQEIKAGQNFFGAHRDELIVSYDDFSARRFASRGQARLTVGHLKAAEADFLLDKTGNAVTVLLDDTFSELDASNTARLIELFGADHQLILTSADNLDLGAKWSKIEL